MSYVVIYKKWSNEMERGTPASKSTPNQTQHIYTDLTKLHTTESDLDGITSLLQFIEVNLMFE